MTNKAKNRPTDNSETTNSFDTTCATEFDCTPLPIPNAAIIPKIANA